jgi:hypothetical protein
MTIEIIISTRHTAAANTLLLLPPPPHRRRISKHAPATAKIALLPSCRLRHQVGCRCRAAAATTSAATLPTPQYHCLQNIKKKLILLTNLFFTTMVTAAHSNNGRNQLNCIEKDKPKNNNKIRQHEKTNPSFNSFSPFSLSNPYFAQAITFAIVISVHRNDRQQRMQPAPSPPLPPSPINYHLHRDD